MTATILHGDCLEILKTFPENHFDSCNTDLPSGTGFMGKNWDKNTILNPKSFNMIERHSFVAFCYNVAIELLRVMKPGAYGTIWALPRTSHWTATAFELAGFTIRDIVVHNFGSGFPKNYDIAKGVEAQLLHGNNSNLNFKSLTGEKGFADPNGLGGFSALSYNQNHRPEQYATHGAFKLQPKTAEGAKWQGWGTALKPSSEFWLLIQKPISESSIAKNVLKWGVGGLNIDACRIHTNEILNGGSREIGNGELYSRQKPKGKYNQNDGGRFPANLVFSHTLFCVPGECADGCPVKELDRQSGFSESKNNVRRNKARKSNSLGKAYDHEALGHEDSGGASRFFNCFDPDEFQRAIFLYTAKPSKSERNAGTGATPVEFGAEVSDAIEPAAKVFNGQSARPSSDLKDVEKRFSTGPAANNHPTVKSTNLIGFLQTLTTPPGGLIIDATAGSATGGVAAIERGFNWVGIEMDERYFAIAQKRLEFAALPPEVKAAQGGQIYIDWLKEL